MEDLERKLLEQYWNYDEGTSRVNAIFDDLKEIKKHPLLLHLIVENFNAQGFDITIPRYYIEVDIRHDLEEKDYTYLISEIFDSMDEANEYYKDWSVDFIKKRNQSFSAQRVFIKDHHIKCISI